MSEINQILDIANNEVGYLEKSREAYEKNPAILYDKTAGAGRDNYTKYAKEMDELCVYNTPKQGYAWCKVFIDWCFVQVVGVNRAKQLLLGWTAGVTQTYNWYKANKLVFSTPKVGDLVIFGDFDHIGIVKDVDNNRIYTIEGNTSGSTGLVANGGSVANKSYARNTSYIKCYCRPPYYSEPVPPSPEPPTPSRDEQIVDIQNWCNSYNCNNIVVDGEFGPETKKAITKVYQTELNIQCKANISVDGEYGPETKKVTPNVYPGAKGNITKSIQAMLYCKHYDTDGVDGIYGPATKKAIEKVQTESGITPVDGVYGPRAGNVIFN